MNWVVDPQTGQYASAFPTPTGIPSDPTLASYGVKQSEQLGAYLLHVEPPVDLIYSSPWYRCLQTLQPFVNSLAPTYSKASHANRPLEIVVEPGLGEFYGRARFTHPSPAPLHELQDFFPRLREETSPIIVPSKNGESVQELHDRVAYCLNELVKRADADSTKPRSLLICTHAAIMIAIGRVLTGRMPADEGEEDFNCFTCAFSRFSRRSRDAVALDVRPWSHDDPENIPDVHWRGGKGIAGGWDCKVNGDCSFLENGAERGW